MLRSNGRAKFKGGPCTVIGVEASGLASVHKLQAGTHHSSSTGSGKRRGESQRGGVEGCSFARR
jgi:hypothetical protein